ncbi:ROK family protein [Phototrophicus methaneseepsis]|uniref:ROK family protein n=1 Tax=Phototrophicus methaneseepsis TaxID=2710758 RepID=A0A7S8IGJ2_9CHLR|nr:ROK family protein [Phototrophicus methaneseepsis]QPC84073.1 ROK family protein [Phototrophicus methaneseepsis]
MTKLSIGVDVGGTKIATALVTRSGQVLAQERIPTLPEGGNSAVLDAIAKSIERVAHSAANSEIEGIGIGIPGAVDPGRGLSLYAVNLGDSWQDVALRDEISSRLTFSAPVFIDNDVNAGGLGELYFGAACGCTDFVYVTLGTGVGGCAVVNQRLLRGTTFTAMEIGHAVVNMAGRPSDFGLRGTPEVYASGKGFALAVADYATAYPQSTLVRNGESSVQAILDAAQQDDALAVRILDEAAETLGSALAWCATILNPQAIIIGGGLGLAARDALDGRLHIAIRQRVIPATYEALRLEYAQVTTSALGPAALVWHELMEPVQVGE